MATNEGAVTLDGKAVALTAQSARTRSAVFITATELEPRTFGKQVVIGGLLDHLCRRLGPENVHVLHIGQAPRSSRPTSYQVHDLPKPRAYEQVSAVLRRVLLPPHTSLQEAALWSPRLRKLMGTALKEIGADLEIWDTIRLGQYAHELPRRGRVLYADDLFSKRYSTMLDTMRDGARQAGNPLGEFTKLLPSLAERLAARRWVYKPLLKVERRLVMRSEAAAPEHFDKTFLVSAEETAELIQRSGRNNIQTLQPLIREPRHHERSFRGLPVFVFLGGLNFPPNLDGLVWFLTHCRDPVLHCMPQFQLLLVGRGAERALPQADAWGEHLQRIGWVDDLDDVFRSSAALLSPLRIGSGVKIKVLEALARGMPVVATPAGVLGLDVDIDDGCLIGKSPKELADCLVATVDPAENAILSDAAMTSWQRRFSPQVVTGSYDDAFGFPRPVG